MTPRQCEIAAESYAASLLARVGFDVLVQYGANQPHYDLAAGRDGRLLPVSVKGSQDGGWMISVKYKTAGVSYHDAIDRWLQAQPGNLVYLFVQFMGVEFGDAPRVYAATPVEIAPHMKLQRAGQGHGVLHESSSIGSRSKYDHRIPQSWIASEERISDVWRGVSDANR